MVRRAAAHKMYDLLAECDKQDILSDMIVIYKQMSQEDSQDTIRIACVQSTLVVAAALDAEENKMHTLSVIQDALQDRSWRVRLTVAKKFDQLCAAFGREITASYLIEPFVQLFKDNEQDVRKE